MFIYEMHQHTKGCSLCGNVTPKEMVNSIKESGFAGVVITNHFYHGNTAIDRTLPWEEFCKKYEEEYLISKEEGEKIGIDVIYGLEEAVGDGKEVLLYGISPDLIAKYPEFREINLKRLSEVVREDGGLVIQAHPYRQRNWITNIDNMLDVNCLDGYEGHNLNNTKEENEKAVALAEKNGLLITAGSDNHSYRAEGRFGISCSHRIKNEKELAQVLKNGDYKLHYSYD
ncbi:MAG: PHP domain-containing protein [Clostridia bacterium]|nr:PHP domain-containing protein [Clostridia bacterium]